MEQINKIGRRKAAVARIYLREKAEGSEGKIVINRRDYKEYFPVPHFQQKVVQPLEISNVMGLYDFHINVNGGGLRGQSEAISLGISRALVDLNEEFRQPLKAAGLLTRDPRRVERKKYGQPKARKNFQFSKR